MSDKKVWLGLRLIPELGNRLGQLTNVFGSAKSIWNASANELASTGKFSPQIAGKIVSQREKLDLDKELSKLADRNIEILTLMDEAYPSLLKEIYYPPPVLFVRGRLVKEHTEAVGIVGARKATLYGKNIAEELAKDLSERGITIVSGLARGVDSCAHRGSLESEGKTIAVLGCGLDVVYPPENKDLQEAIAERGSLVSEYPLGTISHPHNFPARNRIISGLSRGVVIVEAGERSGALITADFALEQGREIFAVPGSVKSYFSKGTHKLIKQGAKLVEDFHDVLEELEINVLEPASSALSENVSLSGQEKKVLEALGWQSHHIDELAGELKFDISALSSLLTVLEIKGFLKQDLGQRYLRIR